MKPTTEQIKRDCGHFEPVTLEGTRQQQDDQRVRESKLICTPCAKVAYQRRIPGRVRERLEAMIEKGAWARVKVTDKLGKPGGTEDATWYFMEMCVADINAQRAARVLRNVGNGEDGVTMTLKAALQNMVDYLTDQLLHNHWRGGSTSVYHNAYDDAQRESAREFMDWTCRLLKEEWIEETPVDPVGVDEAL